MSRVKVGQVWQYYFHRWKGKTVVPDCAEVVSIDIAVQWRDRRLSPWSVAGLPGRAHLSDGLQMLIGYDGRPLHPKDWCLIHDPEEHHDDFMEQQAPMVPPPPTPLFQILGQSANDPLFNLLVQAVNEMGGGTVEVGYNESIYSISCSLVRPDDLYCSDKTLEGVIEKAALSLVGGLDDTSARNRLRAALKDRAKCTS